jgi:spermidine synthase
LEYEEELGSAESRMPQRTERTTVLYLAIALSGFCALSAEVIWTRLLGLLFGASTYAFSVILAVFLIGLGLGSGIGSLIAKRIESPRMAFGCCQLLAVFAVAWSACIMLTSLPYWPINLTMPANMGLIFQLDLVRSLWAALPGPILWGASFPLAVASLAQRGQDAGRLVGGIYAANTGGAIIGSIVRVGPGLLVRISARAADRDDPIRGIWIAAARSDSVSSRTHDASMAPMDVYAAPVRWGWGCGLLGHHGA